jgi:hypothetical protein
MTGALKMYCKFEYARWFFCAKIGNPEYTPVRRCMIEWQGIARLAARRVLYKKLGDYKLTSKEPKHGVIMPKTKKWLSDIA